MGDNHTSITLAISGKVESGQRAVHVDGTLSHHIEEVEVGRLLDMARNNLWRTTPTAGADLGMQLYNLFNRGNATLKGIVDGAVAGNKNVHIYLRVPVELTQLPFELLHNGEFVLLRHNIHVIRLVEDRGKLSPVELKKEPLKMLFMACSPTDVHQTFALKFEDEEERIFSVTRAYNIDMRVEDTGSIEGLRQANIAGGGVDVIHITGHVALDEKMGPVLYMEDEVGKSRKVSPEMLWEAIRDFPPRMLFLSGCSTGSADKRVNSESFAYQMAQRGVRWALGWGLPVSDAGVTRMVTEVYRCLSIGRGVDYAVQSARRMVEKDYHPWPLLRLFGDAAPIVPLLEAGLSIRTANPVTLRHKSLQDSKVRVLESGFVGRRRYVQQGVGVLRGKAGKYGLLVRGPAGIGKSCLVGKLVERVKDKELVVFHGVVSEADVTVKLRAMLKRLGNDEGFAMLKSDKPYGQKIEFLFREAFKNDISTIIYFDDFEQNLIRSGNEYNVKPEAIEVIRPFLEAVDWAEGSSNVMISSRYPFILEVDGEDLSRTKLVDLALISFYGADLDKKASNLEFVAKSSHVEMYLRYGGGNPRLLEWLDVIARDEARYDLKALEAELQRRHGEFIHEFLADVIAETAGEEFHGFIRRAAVYGEPVDATAFAGFGGAHFLDTGVDLTLVEREVRAALAIKDLGRGEFVYWVTPVIRDAMWGNLTPGEQIEMHELAYKWYSDWVKTSSEPNYKYLEEAVRHALAVGDIRGACPYARDLGRYFDGLVLYRQGRAIMEKVAVRVTDEVIGEAKAAKDVAVAGLLHAYAQSLWKLGDANQAIVFHEKSLAIFQAVYGESHPYVAASYHEIGLAWLALGDARQAIAFYEKSLAILQEVYGTRHPYIKRLCNNMAIVYDETGDPQKAADYRVKAKAAWS